MRAMLLDAPRQPLRAAEIPTPKPDDTQVLIEVRACAVCRTDLHVVDGELPHPKLPLVPGHEIVGTVTDRGPGAERFQIGERVGVPWLGWTCGVCEYCRRGQENLCERARFTGYQMDGGFAAPLAAGAARRILTSAPALPATRSTAAMPNSASPTSASALPCRRRTAMSRRRRCC